VSQKPRCKQKANHGAGQKLVSPEVQSENSLLTQRELQKANRYASRANRPPRFGNFAFSKLARPAELDRAKPPFFLPNPLAAATPVFAAFMRYPAASRY
jgi:hypothetical protein